MLASVCINPLVSNATFPYHLKTSENQGVEKCCVGSEWDNDLTNGLSYNAQIFGDDIVLICEQFQTLQINKTNIFEN